MTPDASRATVAAVVDRIVGGHAVLHIGDDEAHVPVEALPAGAGEGSVLRVRPGEPPEVIALDAAETARRREAIERRLERLRGERPSGRFDHPEVFP